MSEGAEAGDEAGIDRAASGDLVLDLPPGRERPGGFVQFDVADVKEAIALAERFRVAGKYRYFRGQRDARWEVTSSFGRADAAGRLKAREEIGAFAAWVRGAERLVPYLADDDKIIAAAQHHRLTPTTFIDFSTDPAVAGWFATEEGVLVPAIIEPRVTGNRAETAAGQLLGWRCPCIALHQFWILGQEGAIYMVDPDEVGGFFEAMTRSGPVLRFLQVEVSNLWRLQAQSGLFLEAQRDIAPIWLFDRIIFAQTGAGPAIERRRIYPDRRSHLEQMIDDYRLQRTGELALEDLIEASRRGGVLDLNVEHPSGDRMPELDLTPLKSPWGAGPDEPWPVVDIESMPPSWSVERIKANPAELADLVATRRNSTDLLMVNPDFPRRNGTAQAAVDSLWEGLRPHPYSAEQIATSLSSLIRLLEIFGDHPLGSGRSHGLEAERLMADPVEIEMGIAGGGATRAFVGSSELWGALSGEVRTRLLLEQPVAGSALMGILGQFYGATLDLFDPHALVDLFASSVVPWQVATQRRPLCFSPTHLKTLGRP